MFSTPKLSLLGLVSLVMAMILKGASGKMIAPLSSTLVELSTHGNLRTNNEEPHRRLPSALLTNFDYSNGFCESPPFTSLNALDDSQYPNTHNLPRYLGIEGDDAVGSSYCGLRLTWTQDLMRASSAFLPVKICDTSTYAFSTHFAYRMYGTDWGDRSADGMAFVVQQDIRGVEALGDLGGGLGVYDDPDQSRPQDGLTPAFIVEMDTYMNTEFADDSQEHIHVVKVVDDGTVSPIQELGEFPTAVRTSPGNNNDGTILGGIWLDYDGSRLRVYHSNSDSLTRPQDPVLDIASVNLASMFNGDTMYVGFAGGTGGKSDNQDVMTWSFTQPWCQPTVELTCPAEPVRVDNEVSVGVTITDPNVDDNFTVDVDWDNGSSDTISGLDGLPLSLTHSYAQAGVYAVKVTVTDSASLSDQGECLAVVYDPDGGFVTGGGTISSPAGAYQPDEGLNGKANFGFVMKYDKDGNPKGNFEFQFKDAELNFHSEASDVLVITNAHDAMMEVRGTINGNMDANGNYYKLRAWVIDGDLDDPPSED